MKNITHIVLSLSLTVFFQNLTFSQNQNGSIDTAGDIAFVIYDSTGNGKLGFVLLDDAPANTSIRFIDQEWTNSGSISGTSEGDLLWVNNTGSTIDAGKVIIIDNANGNGDSVNVGTVSEDDNGFSVSDGDQVIAVTGTRTTPGTFLAFYGDENSVNASETAVLAGTGLTNGTTALTRTNLNLGYYNGFTIFNGTIAEVAAAVNNEANWIFTEESANTPIDFTGTVFGIPSSTTSAPTVSSDDASSIGRTTVTLGGNVTADGGGTVTERGIVYSVTSTNSNPQIGGVGVNKFVSGNSGTGTYMETITELATSTQYSFASYAKNGLETGYGSVKTFTTSAPGVLTLTVTTLDDEIDPGASIASPGGNGLSLREAINLSSSGDTIEFSNSLAGGTITLTVASGRDLDITNKTLIINGDSNGDGAPDITITGGSVDRVFDIFGGSSTDVTLNSLNIVNSTATTNRGSIDDIVATPFSGTVSGGGICILGNSTLDRASLTINKCRIKGNIVQEDGGGIESILANLEINNSLISGNAISGDASSDDGAGLKISESIATLTNTTVAFNTAQNPAGTGDGDGDDIAGRGGFDIVSNSTVTITNCTIAGNIGRISTSEGDEITITGGSSPSSLTITNSIIGGEAQRDPSNQDITNEGTLTIDSNTLITQPIVNTGTLNGTATQDTMGNIFDSTVTSDFTESNALQLNGGVIETIKTAAGVNVGAAPTALIACSAPTDQATSAVFGTETSSALTLNSFSAPSSGADGYAIYVNNTNSFTAPSNGDEPTADTSWNGAGQQPIYFGTGIPSNLEITGLDANTTYYFQIYAYNDCSGTETYETAGLNASDLTAVGPVSNGANGTQISAADGNAIADGSDTETITVQLRDANGNAVSQSGVAIVLNVSGSAVFNSGTGLSLSNSDRTISGTANSSGVLTATIYNTTAESVNVTGTVAGNAIANGSPTAVAFAAGPVSNGANGTQISAADGNAIADGTDTETITVQLRDANGNAVSQSGVAIVLNVSGSAVFNSGTGLSLSNSDRTVSGTTNSSGVLTATIYNTTAESVNVTGTVAGNAIANGSPTAVAFAAGPVSNGANGTQISAADGNAIADGTDTETITVQLRDANGNAVSQSGVAIVLNVSGSAVFNSGTGLSLSNSDRTISGTTNSSGVLTATIDNTTAESVNVTGTVAGNAIANGSPTAVAFVAGPVSNGANGTQISAVDGNAIADGTDTETITVQLRDANGNAVSQSGVAIVLNVSGSAVFNSGTGLSLSNSDRTVSGTTNSSGVLTATIDNTTAESVNVTGTVAGNAIANGSSTAVTFADVTPPTFENSTPSSSNILGTNFILETDIDEAGIIYYVVVADGASAPTSAEVKAGTGSGGSGQVTTGNQTVNSGGFTYDFSVSGLTAVTAYDVYVVAEDDESTPNLQASPTKIDVTTSSALNVSDWSLENLIEVYPNPTQGKLSLRTNGIKLNKLVLYNILGKQVKTIYQIKKDIDISDVNTGVYVLRLETDKGHYERRIIKSR